MGRKLVIDASCLLNLLASGKAEEILEVLELELIATPHLDQEVLYQVTGRDEAGAVTREPVDLEPLEKAGLLTIRPLDPSALDHLVECAEHLTDADAAAVAVAAARELPLATDDARQAKVARKLFPAMEVVSTLEILRQAIPKLALDDASLRQLARRIRTRASFLPPRSDPHRRWFLDLLAGDDGAPEYLVNRRSWH